MGCFNIVGGEILTFPDTLTTHNSGVIPMVFRNIVVHSPHSRSSDLSRSPVTARLPLATRTRRLLHTLGNRVKGAARLQANTNRFESHTNVSVAGFIKGF